MQHHPELHGKRLLITEALKNRERLFSFPKSAIQRVPANRTYVRVRGGFTLPELVCRPPHVIVSASRNWVVFEPRYMIIPPRQIGIGSGGKHPELLKALALYLNSDLVRYHDFFTSPERGVWRGRSTLDALLEIPVPAGLVDEHRSCVDEWCELYDELVAIGPEGTAKDSRALRRALGRTNESVNAQLHLNTTEAQRVTDLVNILSGLDGGKIEPRATGQPNPEEFRRYASVLSHELDTFVSPQAARHSVDIWHDDNQGVIRIGVNANGTGITIHPKRDGTAVITTATLLGQQLAGLSSHGAISTEILPCSRRIDCTSSNQCSGFIGLRVRRCWMLLK